MSSSPTPLERTIDEVITNKESELLTQLNKSYLESITNIDLSKSQIKGEYELFTKNGFNFILKFPIFDE